MSGEPKLPEPGATELAAPSSTLFYLAYAGMFLLLVLGPMYFGARLYRGYDAALGWPGIGAGGMIGIVAVNVLFRCARLSRGWRDALPGFVAAATTVALLAANKVAATVVLWALAPETVIGFNGMAAAFIIAMVLTLPVMLGAFALPSRWQAAALRWRELFNGKRSRRGRDLGAVLGIAAMFPALALTLSFEDWLRAAYPGAGNFSATGFGVLCMLSPSAFIANTGPTDWRSAVRSVLGALVVFEVALAGAATGAVAMATLQSDIVVVILLEFLLLIPVYAGAFILVAHKRGGSSDEVGAGREEETRA